MKAEHCSSINALRNNEALMLERPSEEEGEFEDWRSIKPAYTVCDGNNIKMIQDLNFLSCGKKP